jgi:hypothetical protein
MALTSSGAAAHSPSAAPTAVTISSMPIAPSPLASAAWHSELSVEPRAILAIMISSLMATVPSPLQSPMQPNPRAESAGEITASAA